MEDDRPLTAKEKRQEQIKRWANSATDLECASYTNPKVRVKFDDGAVFLAACSAGDLDEVSALLKGGADINFANVDGLTALHQGCIDGNLEVVKFLVEHGSEIDQEDNEGWTPLHATASCGFMDIAKYLVKKGANVGAVNSEAELAVDIAEEDEMVEYLQSEIDNQGIDVDAARDIERLVMLEDANNILDKYQNGEKIEIYRHQKSGATPLHIAAAKGYNDVMKILIKAGLDVNARDHDGWTPLHAASHWSQEESSKILADKGANFKIRSKLGQTPFDVADEDMLEYLQELETEQKENVKEPIIEPPPSKKEKRSSPTKDSSEILKINEINGEKPIKKIIDKSPESSSEEDGPAPTTRITSPPPRSFSGDTKSSARDRISSLPNDNSKEDVADRYFSRRNRPMSLQMTSTHEEPKHRPLSHTNSADGGTTTKPVAATQPVQAVTRTNRENGSGRTPSYSRDVKEDSPLFWRTGLRKTGSFDDKSKATMQNSKSEIERSSSYTSRFADENKTENTRLARVAPILDARKTKTETETDDSEITSGYQRSTSFGRRKGTDTIPTITTTDTDSTTSFKRSSVSETPSDSTTPAVNDVAGASKLEDPERRRSHLQPVRDEEAEAQRRIRSRRERQTRRSTQGVTLDVVEEAMRTIGQMKQKQPTADKTSTDTTTDTTKSRNDSTSSSTKRSDDSQLATSGSSQSGLYSSASTSSGKPVTSLPSGYIPSDQRVKANESTDSKTTSLNVPAITVDTSPAEDENDKGDTSAENDSSTAQNRKSAAQARRRNRKERRSTGITGLPDLKSAGAATEINNEGEEEESSPKEDVLDSGKAERLRAKYDTSSLPSRSDRHRPGVRNSDSDIPSKFSTGDDISSSYSSRSRVNDTQNYKKLYEDNQAENERLRTELSEAQRKISELQARLEKAEENTTRKQALENEKRERRALERKLSDMEKEIQSSEGAEHLRVANGHLKAENNALQRIVEKLGGGTTNILGRVIEETPQDELKSNSTNLSATKGPKVKSDSFPDLRKLEKEAEKVEEKIVPEVTPAPGKISRSSSSSSLSLEDEGSSTARRTSTISQQSSDTSTRVPYSRREGLESPSSGYSGSSYSSLRSRARLEPSTSSPSLYTRSTSPRSHYSGISDYSHGSTTDYGRSSSFTPSRYTSSSRTGSSGLSSSSGYNTIPGRRDYLKSSTGSSSLRSGTSSLSRTTPSSYSSSSSPSKSSYSSTRPRQGYSSSSTGRSGTSSSTSKLLSKYSPGITSGLSSSRRTMKY